MVTFYDIAKDIILLNLVEDGYRTRNGNNALILQDARVLRDDCPLVIFLQDSRLYEKILVF